MNPTEDNARDDHDARGGKNAADRLPNLGKPIINPNLAALSGGHGVLARNSLCINALSCLNDFMTDGKGGQIGELGVVLRPEVLFAVVNKVGAFFGRSKGLCR